MQEKEPTCYRLGKSKSISEYIVGKWQRITGVWSDDCKLKENKSEDKNRLTNVL